MTLDRRARADRRGRLAAVATLMVVLLAFPAGASAAPFRAVLHAPDHAPKVNAKWRITVDVTRGSQKLAGSVRYEFLFAGQVVSHQSGHKFSGGVYRDALVFPASAVGMTLTLDTIVKTKYGTVTLPWTVTTKR
jgi:hypothetical protein